MRPHPVLSRLGLARKAGKLAIGTEAVKTAIKTNASSLVLISYEISPKTQKEIKFAAQNGTPVLEVPYSIFDITNAIGTKAGIVSINDVGFAEAIKTQIFLSAEKEENL